MFQARISVSVYLGPSPHSQQWYVLFIHYRYLTHFVKFIPCCFIFHCCCELTCSQRFFSVATDISFCLVAVTSRWLMNAFGMLMFHRPTVQPSLERLKWVPFLRSGSRQDPFPCLPSFSMLLRCLSWPEHPFLDLSSIFTSLVHSKARMFRIRLSQIIQNDFFCHFF